MKLASALRQATVIQSTPIAVMIPGRRVIVGIEYASACDGIGGIEDGSTRDMDHDCKPMDLNRKSLRSRSHLSEFIPTPG